MTDDQTTNSHYLAYVFLFGRLGECVFWTWSKIGKSMTIDEWAAIGRESYNVDLAVRIPEQWTKTASDGQDSRGAGRSLERHILLLGHKAWCDTRTVACPQALPVFWLVLKNDRAH